MKIFLVGGAVRDQLLELPVKERDWVVLGATPEQLLRQGFQQVGKDFPVFLHPDTKEEYALARLERKQGTGYHGFVFDYGQHVCLEDDLARRDLTINAMAMDEHGQLIDPYGGLADLNAKILRHVSPAFIEDPVRVLRVARFMARFYHLGFRVAHETQVLMATMVRRGELQHLVAERVCQELLRGLQEQTPEHLIRTLRACGALSVILPEIDALFGVPNSRHYHPEVDSGEHTLMVLMAAARLSQGTPIRFAALVHDLGKSVTPMAMWPSHAGHDVSGVPMIESLCQRLRLPHEYRVLACMVSRFHLTIHRCFELRASTIVTILEQTDAFRRPELFEKLLLVCEADAKGRGDMSQVDYPQADRWRFFLQLCQQINVAPLIKRGFQGEAIRVELHRLRVELVRKQHEK